MELTQEQWQRFYGIFFDEDGDAIDPPESWKPDFSQWVAVSHSDGDFDRWCIAPGEYWDACGYVPDHCIGFKVPGFRECQEHTLDSYATYNEQMIMLLGLGFRVISKPVWGKPSEVLKENQS